MSVPDPAAAGSYTNATSSLTSNGSVVAPAAGDELRIVDVTFSESFSGPSFAGGTPVLTVTIANAGASSPVSGLAFTNNLDATLSGLVATGLPPNGFCGSGSSISGTDSLTFAGGDLAAGDSCTFDINLSVPASASLGNYTNTTSNLTSNGSEIAPAAEATLTPEL